MEPASDLASLVWARGALSTWFEPRRAAYPWRGRRADPYRVLVSEVMLQQTQAARVVPAYRAFLRRFPSLRSLAEASRADVLRAWDGLGYNRRAVWLAEAARTIVRDHAGRIPSDPDALRRLPGVGPYTAAAIASLAFGRSVPAVDTNLRRVIARFALGSDPHAASDPSIRPVADRWIDPADPAVWTQASMDLGREVCRPIPRCDACPLAPACRFLRSGARPAPGPRGRAEPFEGSFRRLRGAVVRILRGGRATATLGSVSAETGEPLERVALAVAALARDGVVRAGPAALAGRADGRVRLPR